MEWWGNRTEKWVEKTGGKIVGVNRSGSRWEWEICAENRRVKWMRKIGVKNTWEK